MIGKDIARIFGGGAKAPPPNAVVLNPVKRVAGMDFTAGRSWLGGLPVLGGAAWPRNPKDGDALHFVAQVALADLPDLGVDMPRTGTLAFFVESDLSRKIDDLPYPQIAGALVWSADADATVTAVPDDCGAIYREDWFYYWKAARSVDDAPRAFPRWPLEPLAFACPTEAPFSTADGTYVDPQARAYAKQFKQRITREIGHDLRGILPARDTIAWRVIRVILDNAAGACAVFDAKIAKNPKFAKRAADFVPLVDTFRDFVETWGERMAGKPQDDPAGADVVADLTRDMSHLAQAMAAVEWDIFNPDYISRFFLNEDGSPGLDNYWHFEDAVLGAYREMCLGSDTEYQALPARIRAFLEQPGGGGAGSGWHQMFGVGTDVQDVAIQMAGKVLLLQLCSDSRVGMMWGDLGFVKFWIAPEDLAAGRWHAALVTFEGS